jgi:hypothetical protein
MNYGSGICDVLRAALVERKTVSAFILDKGLSAAAETLVDRLEFSLSAKQYHGLCRGARCAAEIPRALCNTSPNAKRS